MCAATVIALIMATSTISRAFGFRFSNTMKNGAMQQMITAKLPSIYRLPPSRTVLRPMIAGITRKISAAETAVRFLTAFLRMGSYSVLPMQLPPPR